MCVCLATWRAAFLHWCIGALLHLPPNPCIGLCIRVAPAFCICALALLWVFRGGLVRASWPASWPDACARTHHRTRVLRPGGLRVGASLASCVLCPASCVLCHFFLACHAFCGRRRTAAGRGSGEGWHSQERCGSWRTQHNPKQSKLAMLKV